MKTKVFTMIIVFLLLAATVWGSLRIWHEWERERGAAALTDVTRTRELDDLLGSYQAADDQINQAMRGISLAQGQSGREIWRLRADWATFRENTGTIELQDPIISYSLGEADDTGRRDQVTASAERGTVSENNSRMTMEGNVAADWLEHSLRGPAATFKNEDRILVFPEGAEFSGPGLRGQGGNLQWDMNRNILSGGNGVSLTWTPEPRNNGDSQ